MGGSRPWLCLPSVAFRPGQTVNCGSSSTQAHSAMNAPGDLGGTESWNSITDYYFRNYSTLHPRTPLETVQPYETPLFISPLSFPCEQTSVLAEVKFFSPGFFPGHMFSHQHQMGQADLCGLRSLHLKNLYLVRVSVDMGSQGAELCRGQLVASCMHGETPSLQACCMIRMLPVTL